MTPHTPRDPDFEAKVRASFARQTFMSTIGARLIEVRPGHVTIALAPSVAVTQQHGYVHAGVVTSIADSACGYAAFTLMPPDSDVLSVEFKVNLLRPATGNRLIARGEVLRAGKTLTVCRADVFASDGNNEMLVGTMLGTMMRLPAGTH